MVALDRLITLLHLMRLKLCTRLIINLIYHNSTKEIQAMIRMETILIEVAVDLCKEVHILWMRYELLNKELANLNATWKAFRRPYKSSNKSFKTHTLFKSVFYKR